MLRDTPRTHETPSFRRVPHGSVCPVGSRVKALLFTLVFLFSLGASAQGGTAAAVPVGMPVILATAAAVAGPVVAIFFAMRVARRRVNAPRFRRSGSV